MSKGHDPNFDGSYSSSRYADKSLEEDIIRVINHGIVVGEDSDGGLRKVNLDSGRIDKWTPGTTDKYTHTFTDRETGEQRTEERGNSSQNDSKSNNESSGGCYLTTACLQHFMDDFDDDCHDLKVLRWFRDSFVSSDDIKRYYEIAPQIVAKIESLPAKGQKIVFESIYQNVVSACVDFIERGQYDDAYGRYMNATQTLQRYLLPSVV